VALTKEEQQLVVSVTGRLEVERLTEEYRKAERALADTIKQNQQGTLVGAAYETQLKAQTAALNGVSQSLGKAQGSVREYRQNMVALGYVLNDFFSVQGGIAQRLNAIANNMPMLLAGFSGWGLAAGALLPILGALTPALGKLWETLAGSGVIEQAKTRLESLRETIKAIEAKPVKLAVDYSDLENARKQAEQLQAGLKAFEEWKNLTSKAQQESGRRVGDVLSEAKGGNKEVTDKLEAQRAKEILAADPQYSELQRKAKEAKEAADSIDQDIYAEPGAGDAYRKQAEEFTKEAAARAAQVKEQARGDIGSIYAGARRGDEAQQEELQRRLRGVGRDSLAQDLAAATPRAIKAQEEARKGLAETVKNTSQGLAKNLRRTLDRRQRAGAVGEVNRQIVNRRQRTLTTEIPNAKDPSRPAEKLPITPEVKRQFEEGLAAVLKETSDAMKAAALKGIAAGQLDKQTTFDLVGIANNSAAAASLPPDLREAITTAAAQQSMRGARAGLGPTPVTQPAPQLRQPRGVDAKIQRAHEKNAAQLRADQAEAAADKTAAAAARKKGPKNVLLRRQARWKARKEPKPQQTAPQAAADAQAVDAAQQAAAGEKRAEQVGQAQGRQQAVNQAAAATGKPPEAVQSAMEFLKKQQAVIAAQQNELNQLRGLFTAGGRQAEALRQRQQAEAAQWQSDGYSFLPPWQ